MHPFEQGFRFIFDFIKDLWINHAQSYFPVEAILFWLGILFGVMVILLVAVFFGTIVALGAYGIYGLLGGFEAEAKKKGLSTTRRPME